MENKEEIYFEVGMKVWDLRFGEGEVIADNDSTIFPIRVKFNKRKAIYTLNGRYETNEQISLFQTKPIITPNVPLIQFKKGELVLCRESANGVWGMRYFSHKDDISGFWCFDMQQKTGSCCKWHEIRKFNDNPLLET